VSHRVLAIVTEGLAGSEPIEEIREHGNRGGEGVEVRIVVPAVEASPLRHTLGDVDEPRRRAEERLQASLRLLWGDGVEASGEVGDPDPVQAAEDALLKAPADEILIFERSDTQSRWYDDGLFERAQESLEPPLRMVVVGSRSEDDGDHVVAVESAGPGTVDRDAGREVGSAYFPGLTRSDFGGIVAGIFGTILVIVLAAAAAGSDGNVTGWDAAAVGIAIAVALLNMAHVVGLTLFESVRYRDGFAKFFRDLALTATPVAVLVNLLILLFA
jgi:hypothetical protein